jgi:hypothetical protein
MTVHKDVWLQSERLWLYEDRCLIGLLGVNRRISFVQRVVVTLEPRTQIVKN